MVVVLVSAGEARGEWIGGWTDGNDLLEWCSGGKDEYRLACLGYVTGVAGVMASGSTHRGRSACFPEGVDRGQLTDVVALWLKQHSGERHYYAAGVVAEAFSEAFPCE